MQPFEDQMRAGGESAIQLASRFFMRDDPVHESLRSITKRLADLQIPYAVVGGMALVAHGYDRTTADVDVLVSKEGLDAIHSSPDGFGYVPPSPGSRSLRDTNTGVRIEFVVSGAYPGDGKPKPIAFPPPDQVATDIDGINYVDLQTLIELKLASGMTNAGRLRDLADVQELIRALQLPAEYAGRLNPYVQDKFRELSAGVRGEPDA